MPVFIPEKLDPVPGKPGCEMLPANVVFGGFLAETRGNRLVTAVYEPDLSTLAAEGPTSSPERVTMTYRSRSNPVYWLTITRERDGSYVCRKYRRKTLTGMAMGPAGNWRLFFVQVGLIGLSDNEPGFVENRPPAKKPH
jgi:hypothetical protein